MSATIASTTPLLLDISLGTARSKGLMVTTGMPRTPRFLARGSRRSEESFSALLLLLVYLLPQMLVRLVPSQLRLNSFRTRILKLRRSRWRRRRRRPQLARMGMWP